VKRASAAAWLLAAWLPAAAGVELNHATQAELESLRGIGPDLSSRLLDERRQSPFADWADLVRRVPGIGRARAARLSAAGLTVQGRPFAPAAAASATASAN
jgi:competence protein ComEA